MATDWQAIPSIELSQAELKELISRTKRMTMGRYTPRYSAQDESKLPELYAHIGVHMAMVDTWRVHKKLRTA